MDDILKVRKETPPKRLAFKIFKILNTKGNIEIETIQTGLNSLIRAFAILKRDFGVSIAYVYFDRVEDEKGRKLVRVRVKYPHEKTIKFPFFERKIKISRDIPVAYYVELIKDLNFKVIGIEGLCSEALAALRVATICDEKGYGKRFEYAKVIYRKSEKHGIVAGLRAYILKQVPQ